MKQKALKFTILAALGLSGAQAQALGLVALPDTGFASSAYTNCYNANRVVPYGGIADNTKGNFGSYPIAGANLPSSTTNNTCYVTPPSSPARSPIAGYLPTAAFRTTTIPATTGGTGNIGTIVDRVWRNAGGTMCLFGTTVTMINADHDSSISGTQYFEINDIARGGYANSGTVNAGYTLFVTTASPVYRVGRTFTSVQHRALQYNIAANQAVNGTNYLDLPTKNTVTAAITGENTPINATTPASTTLATQDAVVNSNWVNFTADTVFADDDGSTNPVSGFTYIEAACDSTDPTTWVKTGAIRLRQTAQEETTFKEIAIDGFAPPGATVP
jgi:hypothetical protein